MKQHKFLKLFGFATLVSLTLTSCSGIFNWIDENLFGKDNNAGGNTPLIVADKSNTGDNSNLKIDHDTFGVSLNKPSNKKTPLELASQDQLDAVYADGIDVLNKYCDNYQTQTQSRGNPRVLVVPLLFKGTALNQDVFTEADARKMLTKAFFGDNSEMEWESLSSYYSKASFGALNFQGEVAPVYKSKYRYEDIAKAQEDVGYAMVDNIVADIYDTFFATPNRYNISDFDDNKDGNIDGLYVVYLNFHKLESALWAYETSLDYENHLTRKPMNNYVWMSFDFFENLSKPVAQTVIHESGHMLGLEDYYNTFDQELTLPTGGVDMMDYNVGYQESFSSYYLGWTVPYVIDDHVSQDINQFTLRPFGQTGDCLLVASDFNGTSYDEYLMIEYYTPDGLNKEFVTRNPNTSQEINKPGIIIYHVDARLGRMVFDQDVGWTWSGEYLDRIETGENYFSYIVANNGKSLDGKEGYSFSGFNLVSIMDGNAVNGFNKFEHKASKANSSTLFKTNETFLQHFPNFHFNDQSKLNFDIKVGQMNEEGCQLTIQRI